MKKRISQRDIAHLLGINVSTVSRALKGLPGVSTVLREKIISLAEKKDYRPNPFAMSLRYDTTHTIGIVVPDMSFNHFAHIVKWIEAEARKKGYMCIITDSGDNSHDEKDCIDHLLNLHVEGIALCLSQDTTDFSHIERLRNSHIPVVLFDRVADVDCSMVSANDVESARQATLHLIDDGATRIAFLGGPNHLKQTVDRKHGYLEALRERGLSIKKELVKCGKVSFNAGLSDTLELLNLPEPPDAILADHGMLSISAFQAIVSKGICVPDELAFVGFMSDWVSGMTYPRLTFVKQNLKEIGCQVFKLLYEQMSGDKTVRHIVVNARLNIRESTRNKS
jgi:LacI family transcriptional regulator